jgi:hypothetical protein
MHSRGIWGLILPSVTAHIELQIEINLKFSSDSYLGEPMRKMLSQYYATEMIEKCKACLDARFELGVVVNQAWLGSYKANTTSYFKQICLCECMTWLTWKNVKEFRLSLFSLLFCTDNKSCLQNQYTNKSSSHLTCTYTEYC